MVTREEIKEETIYEQEVKCIIKSAEKQGRKYKVINEKVARKNIEKNLVVKYTTENWKKVRKEKKGKEVRTLIRRGRRGGE